MSILKRYMPSKVKDFIYTCNYEDKDHLYFICDLIYRRRNSIKSDLPYLHFTNIPREYFTNVISNWKVFNSDIQFLINNNVVDGDDLFIQGRKCKGYKINDKFISTIDSVTIDKRTLIKNIIKGVNTQKQTEHLKEYKKHFLKSFKINYKDAIEYVESLVVKDFYQIYNSYHPNTPLLPATKTDLSYIQHMFESEPCADKKMTYGNLIEKYNYYRFSIEVINDGDLFFKRNKTNLRIDTNLTSLKSDLKKFIIGAENLIQIDISNSQPTLLYFLIKNENINKKEIQKYKEWVLSGKYYEKFIDEYYISTLKKIDRKKIKDIMFCIFYSKNDSYKYDKEIFRKIFPSIMRWIENQKVDKHNKLAIDLQKVESEIVIDTICKELTEVEIKYYTIHDSWIVNKDNQEETVKIIKREFMNKYNEIPDLKISGL